MYPLFILFHNYTHYFFLGLEDLLDPKQIPDPVIASKNKQDYIFMSCLDYIHEVSLTTING